MTIIHSSFIHHFRIFFFCVSTTSTTKLSNKKEKSKQEARKKQAKGKKKASKRKGKSKQKERKNWERKKETLNGTYVLFINFITGECNYFDYISLSSLSFLSVFLFPLSLFSLCHSKIVHIVRDSHSGVCLNSVFISR